MTMAQKTVLVIGGGVAGALTSLFLKQNGFSPEIYERVATFTDVGVSIEMIKVLILTETNC